jgi:hypothetical protein
MCRIAAKAIDHLAQDIAPAVQAGCGKDQTDALSHAAFVQDGLRPVRSEF